MLVPIKVTLQKAGEIWETSEKSVVTEGSYLVLSGGKSLQLALFKLFRFSGLNLVFLKNPGGH